jgi:hypothetical protein
MAYAILIGFVVLFVVVVGSSLYRDARYEWPRLKRNAQKRGYRYRKPGRDNPDSYPGHGGGAGGRRNVASLSRPDLASPIRRIL